MRFWDTSAIVPLVIREPASQQLRRLAEEDRSLIVWWGTRTECLSALLRRGRDGSIPDPAARQARDVLRALGSAWSEVLPSETLRERAERLLALHPLCAADAFQLAAALIWGREQPKGRNFVSLDLRLRESAAREGFAVLPA